MLSPIFRKYSNRFLSKWIVLLFDLTVVVVALPVAFLIRFNFDIPQAFSYLNYGVIALITVSYLIAFLLFRSHIGIIRFTGLVEAYRVFKATIVAALILLLVRLVAGNTDLTLPFVLSAAVVIIHYMITLLTLIGSRFIIRSFYSMIVNRDRKEKLRVLIYGAGSAGMITRTALQKDRFVHYDIIGYIDDNRAKQNKRIEGVPVYSPKVALSEEFVNQHKITSMILSIQQLDVGHKKSIIEKSGRAHIYCWHNYDSFICFRVFNY